MQKLPYTRCCLSWSFYPKTVGLSLLNEMHTNSYTDPRLLKTIHTCTFWNEIISGGNSVSEVVGQSFTNFRQHYVALLQSWSKH